MTTDTILSHIEENAILKNGIWYFDDELIDKKEFNTYYSKVQKQENRILSDEQVMLLPEYEGKYQRVQEWFLRKESANKFTSYLDKYLTSHGPKKVNILDLGAGNCWFANYIQRDETNIYAVDINLTELKQGQRLFNSENIDFILADIMRHDIFPNNSIDIIVMNATLQYFSNVKKLIRRLQKFLVKNGEIHLIDTPIYHSSRQVKDAEQSDRKYFERINVPEMIEFYFHHKYSSFWRYKEEILHNPNSLKNRIKSNFIDVNPLYWIKIKI